jgi:hypothetical protein
MDPRGQNRNEPKVFTWGQYYERLTTPHELNQTAEFAVV